MNGKRCFKMNKLSFNEITNIDYKFIFEYFDSPLSFIGESKGRNYLFYYIDDDSFFISELRKNDIKKLTEFKNLTLFIAYLIELEKLQLIKFNFEQDIIEYIKLEQADFEFEKFLPTSNRIIDFDYHLGIEISKEFDFSEILSFPLETENMTIRITDATNSHVYSYELIENVMVYVKRSFEVIKESLELTGKIIGQELMMKPHTNGSFRVNFLVSEDKSMFDNNIDFYPILNMIDEVTTDNRELNFELINEKEGIALIENIDNLFKVIKKEGVIIEFYDEENSDKKLAKLSSNDLVKNNLQVYQDKISDLNKLTITKETSKLTKSKFKTGSIIYNSVKIDVEGETVKAKFDKELFKKIKNSTEHLTLDKDIEADLITEILKDANQNVLKRNIVITNFKYL